VQRCPTAPVKAAPVERDPPSSCALHRRLEDAVARAARAHEGSRAVVARQQELEAELRETLAQIEARRRGFAAPRDG
jgi:hypothetical protein